MDRLWKPFLIALLGVAGCGKHGVPAMDEAVSIRIAGMVKAQGIT